MTTPELILMAIEEGQFPRYLYKYRHENANPKGLGENIFTQKIITDNELWFSPPADFNDPYDCNTTIYSDTSVDEFNDWFSKVGLGRVMNIDEAKKLIAANEDKLLKDVIDSINLFWICCFSKIDNSILQWSHYSNYHKGICLGFDLTKQPDFFAIPQNVFYNENMTPYNHFKDSNEIVKNVIAAKYKDWSYEQELRVVKSPADIKKNGNYRGFMFNDSTLNEVIFGAKTPQSIIDQYKDLCRAHNKSHVKFFKMKLATGTRYELIKEPI